ncbi:uncharacterized protein EDB91DRAFT_899583 [Suillus paluster]|uniref:uncharacterized protein n=1 Tax=Suillus paluster TaxID=48578 RepID=UPI001B86B63C|nr:uncharacterized protein EDB91DRAFT_899583 [Suillus paluster]KAG1726971.1 hypothetical protein EDB91DRAFT_899583 [Suillus paluster]
MAMGIDMKMDTARFDPMDAQRFDPLRRSMKKTSPSQTGTFKLTMGQGLCIRTRPRAAVGAVWPDHEVVVVPLSAGDGDLESEGGFASRSSTPTSTPTSTTDTRVSSPTSGVDVPQSHTQEVDGIVVTRTIIRANPNPNRTPSRRPSRTQMTLTRMFSRSPPPSTSHSPSASLCELPRSNPPSRPTSPVLQALNCFSTSSAFESDVNDMHEREDSLGPVLHVIVTQSRERYEDDRAFKEIVGSVYPGPAAAAVIGGGA